MPKQRCIYNVNFTLINQHRSEDGRKLILNGSIDDNNVMLVCLYAPNKKQVRLHFLNGANNWIKKNMMFEDAIIISGDLNCCLREFDRRPCDTVKNDYSRKGLTKMINDLNLYNCWVKLKGDKLGFTFFNKRTGGASKLDYLLISNNFPLIPNIMKVCICVVPNPESIIDSFKIDNYPSGSGYWKFNNQHLLDPAYNEQVRQIMFETEQEYELLTSYRLHGNS